MPGDGIDDVHNLVLPGIGGGKFSGRLVKGGGGDGIDTALSGNIKHPSGSFFRGHLPQRHRIHGYVRPARTRRAPSAMATAS